MNEEQNVELKTFKIQHLGLIRDPSYRICQLNEYGGGRVEERSSLDSEIEIQWAKY